MKQIRLQQGDSFMMNFVVKVNDQPQNLNNGENIAVGLYDEYGQKYVVTSSDGIIQNKSTSGFYSVMIPSSVTKNFQGNVDVEIVIYNSDGKKASHADNVIQLYFEERKINQDI